MTKKSAAAAAPVGEFDGNYATEQLRRSKDPIRRFVKGFYLRNMLRDVQGPTVDFGCGAGQLLALLPAGSVGIEVNPHLILSLRSAGHTVHQARAEITDFDLPDITAGTFRSLVIAHVLEHLPDSVLALQRLLAACRRVGIQRVIVVVPGAKGFASDHTHKTFIDAAWLQTKLPQRMEGFVRAAPSYFPGPWAWVGRFFVFHETKVVFTAESGQG